METTDVVIRPDLFWKDRSFRVRLLHCKYKREANTREHGRSDLSAINAHEGVRGVRTKMSFSQRRNDCLGHPVLNWCLPTFPITRRKSPSFGFKSGHRICTRRTVMGAKAGGRIEECAKRNELRRVRKNALAVEQAFGEENVG